MFKDQCLRKTCDTIIALKENRSIFYFKNNTNEEIIIIKIDNCEITEDKRCDYMLICGTHCIYLELKGNKINYALEQLAATIVQKNITDKEKTAIVVSSRCPLAGSEISKAQQDFKKKYNTKLIIKNSPCHYNPA